MFRPKPDEEPQYRLDLHFHDRQTGKLLEAKTIEAYSQGQALFLIFKAAMRHDPHKVYLVVKTDGCKQRPLFIIKNLRARGIQVVEPEVYENGDRGAFPS